MSEADPKAPAEKKGRDVWRRFVVALIGVPIILALAFYAPNWALWAFYTAAASIGASEYVSMTLPKRKPLQTWAVLSTLGLLTTFYWAGAWPMYGAAAAALLGVFLTAMATADRIDDMAARIGHTTAAIAYCTLLFGGLIALFATPSARAEVGEHQAGWFLFPMFVIWLGDTGAYFAGRRFGKHKLAARLSPKKTWEGAIGGMAASIAGGFLARALFFPDMPAWACLALAAPGAALGQLGDLAESLIKRSTGVKDSGKILYGHGGVLDRVDALLFAAPYFACVKQLLSL